MSLFELNLVGNPRTDRGYRATLATETPLLCRSADCGVGGHVSVLLTYTPDEQCIEIRSFGRYLSHLLQENDLDQDLLQRIAGDVLDACHPSSVSVKADFGSEDGFSVTLHACYPPKTE